MKRGSHIPPSIFDKLSALRRRYRAQNRLAGGLFDVVPLVNVVLLLFLFFVVNSASVLQPGAVVNLPTSSFASGAPYGSLVVTVSQEGLVFFNDEQTTIEALEAAFTQAALDHPGAPLIIEADGRVQHSTLVQIYNMAMAGGIKEAVLATRLPAAIKTAP